MAVHYSTAVRNAQLDALETAIGTSAIMKIFDDDDDGGSIPANCAAADVGTVLATIALGSDWMANASSGSKAKNGTWADTSADASGTAYYFRIYASDGTTCHIQGTVSGLSGGGNIELQNIVVVATQSITISAFSIAAGNT